MINDQAFDYVKNISNCTSAITTETIPAISEVVDSTLTGTISDSINTLTYVPYGYGYTPDLNGVSSSPNWLDPNGLCFGGGGGSINTPGITIHIDENGCPSLVSANEDNKNDDIIEEENEMANSVNTLTSMFHKLAPGQCRLSMNGIAIKTSNGYKTFDPTTQTLVNCADFVFDIADDMFFCLPTNSVQTGDIIIASGAPVCVISVNGNRIEALRYEDSTVVTIIPENIMFMGNVYFFSKVISPYGGLLNDPSQFMQLKMMSEMFKGESKGMGSMLALGMMMNGGLDFSKMFSGMFGNKTETTDNTKEG